MEEKSDKPLVSEAQIHRAGCKFGVWGFGLFAVLSLICAIYTWNLWSNQSTELAEVRNELAVSEEALVLSESNLDLMGEEMEGMEKELSAPPALEEQWVMSTGLLMMTMPGTYSVAQFDGGGKSTITVGDPRSDGRLNFNVFSRLDEDNAPVAFDVWRESFTELEERFMVGDIEFIQVTIDTGAPVTAYIADLPPSGREGIDEHLHVTIAGDDNGGLREVLESIVVLPAEEARANARIIP